MEPQKALLSGFERVLDNESSRHSLGFEVHRKDRENVEGMLHKAPTKDLCDFLRVEGVLDKNCAIRGSPSYWVTERTIQPEGKTVQALCLVGNRRHTEEGRRRLARDTRGALEGYIEASLNGASARGIGMGPFKKDQDWLESL